MLVEINWQILTAQIWFWINNRRKCDISSPRSSFILVWKCFETFLGLVCYAELQRDFQSCLSLKIQIQSVLKLSWVLYAEELPKLSFAKNTNALRSPLPEVVDIHNDIQKCSKLSEMKDKSYIYALISIKHHDHKKVIVKKMHRPL